MESDHNFQYKFPAESKLSFILGGISLMLLTYISIALIVADSLKFKLLAVPFIAVIIFVLFKLRISTSFHNNGIKCRKLFSKDNIPYDKLKNIYRNKEGFLPVHVYVIKYTSGGKIKKSTFYCNEDEYQEVLNYIKLKKIKKNETN